jgi:hypothetical protein
MWGAECPQFWSFLGSSGFPFLAPQITQKTPQNCNAGVALCNKIEHSVGASTCKLVAGFEVAPKS